MRSILATILMLTVMVTTVHSSNGGFALPGELAIWLPQGGAVQTEWLAPPLPTTEVSRAGLDVRRFRLDRKLATWMLHSSGTLTNLDSGVAFTITRKVNDFIWLGDGTLLLAGEKDLGTISPFRGKEEFATRVPEVQFQPLIPLPATGCRLATDGKEAIFAFGYDPELRSHAVFRMLSGFAGWQRLFVSNERITDVCFDGTTLSVAAGRTIHRLRPGDRGSLEGFSHPGADFTGVTCSQGGGLFFSTARGIGVKGDAAVEFIRSNRTQIEARDGSLYLFMPESLGVLRIDNIEKLAKKPAP